MSQVITISDFIYNYDPISDPMTDAIMLGTSDIERVSSAFQANPQKVWTMVEEQGVQTIIPGMLRTDEVGYFICNIARDNDDIVVNM